jgi:hypothetical protein
LRLSCLLRLGVLSPSLWRRFELFILTLPLFVTENLFAVALCVLILGIMIFPFDMTLAAKPLFDYFFIGDIISESLRPSRTAFFSVVPYSEHAATNLSIIAVPSSG